MTIEEPIKRFFFIFGAILLTTFGLGIGEVNREPLIIENAHAYWDAGQPKESAGLNAGGEETGGSYTLDGGESMEAGAGDTHKAPAASASIEELTEEFFPENPRLAKAVIMAESLGWAWNESKTDRMADGRAFSVGLLQINLTYHGVGGLDCPKAFRDHNKRAVVVNESLYKQCVEAAKDPRKNMEAGRKIWEKSGGNYTQWGGFTGGGHIKYL